MKNTVAYAQELGICDLQASEIMTRHF